MTEDQVRQIIREELMSFMTSDRYTFQKHLQLFDGRNIQVGVTTGTKIGTSATQKLAFYGVAPTAQQAAITTPSGGATVDSSARTAIDTIISTLQNLGLTA